MDTVNKVCVFIRGAARTWNYTKQSILSTLNYYFQNPDFYFLTVDSGTVSDQSLSEDFKDSNLIHKKIIPIDAAILPFEGKRNTSTKWNDFSTNYFRMAWYDWHLGIVKREHEIQTGKRYNLIFYTRPDCFLGNLYQEPFNLKYSRITEQDIIGIIGERRAIRFGEVVTNDINYIAGARAANIFNCRYYDTKYTDGKSFQGTHGDHQNIAYYLYKNFITARHSEYPLPGGPMVRPNALEYLMTSTDNDHIKYQKLDTYVKQFLDLPSNEKIKLCKQYNIGTYDYQRFF